MAGERRILMSQAGEGDFRGLSAGARGPSRPPSNAVLALLLADRLLSLTLLAFEGLNTASSKDRCLACIEEPFFSPLWPLLLALYRYGPDSGPHRTFPTHWSAPSPFLDLWGFALRPPSGVSSSPGQLSLASVHPRSVHRLREAALSRSMELYRNAPPAAIGIPPKLLPQDGPEARGTGSFPYRAAAQELGLLVLETCPQKKLECIGEAVVLEKERGW